MFHFITNVMQCSLYYPEIKLTDNITFLQHYFKKKNQYDALALIQRRNKREVVCNKIIRTEKGYPRIHNELSRNLHLPIIKMDSLGSKRSKVIFLRSIQEVQDIKEQR